MRKIYVREREKERMNERNMGEDEKKTSQREKERRKGGERERQRNIVNEYFVYLLHKARIVTT